MKLLWLTFLVLAAASNLLRVNDKNFNDVVKNSGKFTLVDFYADWCRHCMNLMPAIEELADLYADVEDIQIVKINGDEDGRKMTSKYDIPGFPTLLLFHGNDNPIEYDGMRDAESISNFIQQASGVRLSKSGETDEQEISITKPTQIMALDDDNFKEKVLDANYKTLVMFSALWCRYCKEVKPFWEEIANKIFDSDSEIIRFGEVDLSEENNSKAEKIKEQFGVRLLPSIMLFDPSRIDKDGLKRPVVYNDDRNLEYLVTFVNDETGLSRNYEGKLFANAGRILSIDEAIEAYEGHNGEAIVRKIEELESQFLEHGRDFLVEKNILFFKDDMSMTSYYKKIVGRIINDDKEYFVGETARLRSLVSKEEANMERTAYDYMQKRLNILEAVSKMKKF
ncbi:CIC11C00000002160 [Sungouiella intermedia]|uniref:protein disulfide-isomerase n=1 Tax=Sungouiella intermedia TaxID=45354 RepID=A0A1L0DCC4_9ASCO|nr:CIC11C00000002160 [[Candida] intermedia]